MNEKMKKIMTALIVIIVIFFVIASYIVNKQRGDIHDVQRTVGVSTIYSDKDITDAMNLVLNHFFLNFKGCTLTDIWYPGDESLPAAEGWAAQYNADEAIVLLSNFDVDSSGGDGSLNPNSTYNNWQWILVRDSGENWELKTWGY